MPVLDFSSDFWIDFPSEKDWEQIYQHSPCSDFLVKLYLLDDSFESLNYGGFPKNWQLGDLVWQLHYREVDISKSFVLLSYYFEKGIPDEQSDNKKPGEYPRNLKKEHVNIKNWFDYHVDYFYYKLFSAWDTIGHMLNIYFDLELDVRGVDFPHAVLALKKIDLELFEKLDNIRNSPTYKKAKNFRNEVTHNYLPGSLSMAVTTETTESEILVELSGRKYIESKEIMKNILETLELFQETVKVITETNFKNSNGG